MSVLAAAARGENVLFRRPVAEEEMRDAREGFEVEGVGFDGDGEVDCFCSGGFEGFGFGGGGGFESSAMVRTDAALRDYRRVWSLVFGFVRSGGFVYRQGWDIFLNISPLSRHSRACGRRLFRRGGC